MCSLKGDHGWVYSRSPHEMLTLRRAPHRLGPQAWACKVEIANLRSLICAASPTWPCLQATGQDALASVCLAQLNGTGTYPSASVAYSTDLGVYALTPSVTAGSPLPADGDGLVAAINTPKLSNTGQFFTSTSLHEARAPVCFEKPETGCHQKMELMTAS